MGFNRIKCTIHVKSIYINGVIYQKIPYQKNRDYPYKNNQDFTY